MAIVNPDENIEASSIIAEMANHSISFVELNIERLMTARNGLFGYQFTPSHAAAPFQTPNSQIGRLFIITEEQDDDLSKWLQTNFTHITAQGENFPDHGTQEFFHYTFGSLTFLPFQSKCYVKHIVDKDKNDNYIVIATVRNVDFVTHFWKQYLEFVSKTFIHGLPSQMLRPLSKMFEVGIDIGLAAHELQVSA